MSDNRHSLCCILQRDFSYEEVDRNKYREGLADANNAPQACCKIKPVQLLVKLKSFAARFNYSQLHLWTSRWSQGTHLFVCFVVMTKVLLEESSHYTSGSKKFWFMDAKSTVTRSIILLHTDGQEQPDWGGEGSKLNLGHLLLCWSCLGCASILTSRRRHPITEELHASPKRDLEGAWGRWAKVGKEGFTWEPRHLRQ